MESLMGGGIGYAMQQEQGYANAKMASMPTMKQRLDLAVREAEDKLAAVKEARDIFERNPDIERLLDLMQKSRF